MGFELAIAAKRDVVARAEALQREAAFPKGSSIPIAAININGVFSDEGAGELAKIIQGVLHKPADTVILRFEEIACEDPASLAKFVRWIADLRSNGHNVRMVSGECHLDALLLDRTIAPGAVMAPADADVATGRITADKHQD